MKKLILAGGVNGPPVKVFHLRDGLMPTLSDELTPTPPLGNSTNSSRMGISPDQTKIALTAGSTGPSNMLNSVYEPTDDEFCRGVVASPVSFSGSVQCCDTSNTHRAYGGGSPFLYVFDWASGALQVVSVTGLSTVQALKFSPDGQFLAVLHIATPFLRIYKTSDWTFVNAATAFNSQGAAIEWAPDSSRVVVGSGANTAALAVYSTAGVRLHVTTTSAFAYQVKDIAYSSMLNCVFYTNGNVTGISRLRSLDMSTYAVTQVVDLPVLQHQLAVDDDGGYLYCVHDAHNAAYISRLKLSALESYEPLPAEVQHHISGSNACLRIIKKNTGKITGTVRDINNAPVARTILAYERVSGRLAAKTISDVATGNYVLRVQTIREHDLVFRALPGEALNDLFFARVEPEAN